MGECYRDEGGSVWVVLAVVYGGGPDVYLVVRFEGGPGRWATCRDGVVYVERDV